MTDTYGRNIHIPLAARRKLENIQLERRRKAAKIINERTPENQLPDKPEDILDWRTGKPKRGLRHRTARGNIRVKH